VAVMNSAFRSIRISIIVFRAPNFAGAFFSVIDAIFRAMPVDDRLRPAQ
jgi:hypothetical protein